MATIKDKADHVRQRLRVDRTRNHRCHWPGCIRQVPPAAWGCREHWFMLPLTYRNRIWALYRIRQEEDRRPSRAYVLLALEVRQWIMVNHPPRRKKDLAPRRNSR